MRVALPLRGVFPSTTVLTVGAVRQIFIMFVVFALAIDNFYNF
jgi:hypothetical protein